MSTYTYRRELDREGWLKAIGVGVGAGVGTALVAGYLAKIFLQRTPLRPPNPSAPPAQPR